jgi:hypothetical protein
MEMQAHGTLVVVTAQKCERRYQSAERRKQFETSGATRAPTILPAVRLEPKLVEKARLLSMLSSHHRRIVLPSFNQFSPSRKPFSDSTIPDISAVC